MRCVTPDWGTGPGVEAVADVSGVFDQITHLRGVRGVRDNVLTCDIQPVRSTLRRPGAAYAGFYRRCRNG